VCGYAGTRVWVRARGGIFRGIELASELEVRDWRASGIACACATGRREGSSKESSTDA